MNDHFRVALGLKTMPLTLQKCAQFLVVIDFSVENNLDAFVLVRDGLMTTLQVDDREPPETKTNRAGDIVPIIVGPAMVQRVGHSLHECGRNRRLTTKHQFSAD